MKTTSHKTAIILLVSSIGLNGCCLFKQGAWAPLPSCKNAAEFAKKKEMEKGQKNEARKNSDLDEKKE